MYDETSFNTSKNRTRATRITMNGVHMPHETLLRPLELYTCKIDSFNRTYFDFSTKAIKADAGMRPKRI